MSLLNWLNGDLFSALRDKTNATIDAVNVLNSKLQGGTTGQSIKKASNTDFDYVFYTPYALPTQTSNGGKVLTTNGTSDSWTFGTKVTGTFDSITPDSGAITINSQTLKYAYIGGIVTVSFSINYTVTSGTPLALTCVVPSTIRPTVDDYWGEIVISANSATNYQSRTLVASNGIIISAPDNAALNAPGPTTLRGSLSYPIF